MKLIVAIVKPFKLDEVHEVIDEACTGKIVDGKVWVVPIEATYRIRTGEAGADAL